MALTKMLLALGLAQILTAQVPATKPVRFEVVSVRPSAQADSSNATRIDVGVHINKQQVRISSLSLKDYLAWAYEVGGNQLDGPDWLASFRFDINATMPEGATDKQIPEMLRAVLEERFGLKFHKTQKEFTVYVLERGKKPLGLAKVELGPEEEGGGQTFGGSGTRDGISVNMGRGASYTFADSKFEAKKLDMDSLVGSLAQFLELPVVNKTGLEGYYDVVLPVALEDYQAMRIRAAQKVGIVLPPQALKLLEGATNASLFDAIDSVGLKMESRKLPLDVINVDEIRRQPTEN